MKSKKRPFSWIVEECVFGATTSKEEIEPHKREDKVRWSLYKATGIRLFYVYLFVMACILAGIGIVARIYGERKGN